jgi:glutathione synthase/RimK-type ligase-like ATP-grasp enzyme
VLLAITTPDDDHAAPVLAEVARRGLEAAVLDLAALPAHGRLALGYGGAGQRLVSPDGGPVIDAGRVTAGWWRRPRQPVPAATLAPAHAAFALRQTGEAVMGLLASLDAGWMNDPWRDEVASHKPRQLALAEAVGLPVPPTLVTNDPSAARAFLRAHRRGGAVHKALHATPGDWRPTRRVGREDLERLDALPLAPVILQAHVPGVDVRVTAVGRRLFAAAIDARRTRSPDDFRTAWADSRVAPLRLPGPLATRLGRLVAALGLEYAAVDLRRRPDGGWAFLELNPAGLWRFVEERLGLPITAAVAARLVALSRRHAGRRPSSRRGRGPGSMAAWRSRSG